jgi:hypothetical protein
MMTHASDEFVAKARTMGDDELLANYFRYRAKFDALEEERMKCWNRFMEIQQEQDAMGGEMQALGVIATYGRGLKVR